MHANQLDRQQRFGGGPGAEFREESLRPQERIVAPR
jgi:hypothetical protein